MNSRPSMFPLRDAFPSRVAAPDRHALIRAAALAAAVHLWLLFGISLDMPMSSAGGAQEITVEITSALASRAARNSPDNSPADGASAVDNPAEGDNTTDTAPPENTRDATAPEKTREFAALTEIAPAAAALPENTPQPAVPAQTPKADTTPAADTPMETVRNDTPHSSSSNKALPAAVANPSRARPAERGTRPRNPERPSVTPRNNAAGSSRNSAAGATAERETASGAALSGISADESLQTVYNPAPRYPEQARRRGREGTVLVEADVDERGVPAAVRVLRSSGFGILDDAAVEAVGKWRFRPARSTGKTMPGRVVVPIEFRLKKF